MSFFTNLMAGLGGGGGALAQTISEIQEEKRLREVAQADQAYREGMLAEQGLNRASEIERWDADRKQRRIDAGYDRLLSLQTNPDITTTIGPHGVYGDDPMRGVAWTRNEWEDTPAGLASAAADKRAQFSAQADIDEENRDTILLGKITRAYNTAGNNMSVARRMLLEGGMTDKDADEAEGLFIIDRNAQNRALGGGINRQVSAQYTEIPKSGLGAKAASTKVPMGSGPTEWERALSGDSASTVAAGDPWNTVIGERNLTTPTTEYMGLPPLDFGVTAYDNQLKEIATSLTSGPSMVSGPNMEPMFNQRAEAMGIPPEAVQAYLQAYPIR